MSAREVHVRCADPQICTTRFSTDSDLRSASASITVSNKRVLSFFITATFLTFLLCHRFLLLKNIH